MLIKQFLPHHRNNSSFYSVMFVAMLAFCPVSHVFSQEPTVETNSASPNIVHVPSAVTKIADSVSVPAEYEGVLTLVLVKEGQLVKKGDPIAKINDAELRIRLDRAQIENQIASVTAENDVDIRFSEKSQEVAQSDVFRSQRANAKVNNSVSIARFEKQVLERDRTKLQLEQAQRDFAIARMKTNLTKNELELSQLLLSKTEIRAPMDGMVVSVERREGEWVKPSETIVKIVKVDRLRVEGFVSAENASRIQIGAPVEVKFTQDWFQGQSLSGQVVFVSPEANPVNSQILVWAEIKNEQNNLLPGLRGEIFIQTGEIPQVGKR